MSNYLSVSFCITYKNFKRHFTTKLADVKQNKALHNKISSLNSHRIKGKLKAQGSLRLLAFKNTAEKLCLDDKFVKQLFCLETLRQTLIYMF